MLPRVFPPFPERQELDIFATTRTESLNIGDSIVPVMISSLAARKDADVDSFDDNLNVYRSYMQRIPKINRLNNIRFINKLRIPKASTDSQVVFTFVTPYPSTTFINIPPYSRIVLF